MGRRLPPVPLLSVALEPEQQVGSAVTTTGFPPKWSCTNVADRTRPRGKYLGPKGFQASIEHRRRRQRDLTACPADFPVSGNEKLTEVQLPTAAEHAFNAVRQ